MLVGSEPYICWSAGYPRTGGAAWDPGIWSSAS